MPLQAGANVGMVTTDGAKIPSAVIGNNGHQGGDTFVANFATINAGADRKDPSYAKNKSYIVEIHFTGGVWKVKDIEPVG